MPHDANALQLLQYKRQPPQAPRSPAHRASPAQSSPWQPKQESKPTMDVYDVRWEAGALGLRFTPNENDDAVVCQIMDTASDAVRRSRVAVGDVVVAVQVHAIGAPMAPIASLQEMAQVFQHEDLPITVRFRSRAHEVPQAIELVDIARSYTYAWPPGQPLGVSLAMDPCSLHTIITSVDHDRISPDFLPLDPQPGDILVSVRDLERKADLDSVRFDKVVDTLKSFPRPCKLTFARLHEGVTSPTNGERRRSASGQQRRPSSGINTPSADQIALQQQQQPPRSPSHAHQAVPPAPFSAPPAPTRQPMRRPAPLMKRQSFAVGEIQKVQHQEQMQHQQQQDPRVLSKEEAKLKAQRDARFYKIVYSGGHIGLVLNDAKLELKGKPKKNGYYAVIKKVPSKKALEGLEQASEGDELIAIGRHDLQHVAFEDVQQELASIRSPTPLVFQRKPQPNVSVGASLVDGLLMFLI